MRGEASRFVFCVSWSSCVLLLGRFAKKHAAGWFVIRER